MTGPRFGSVSFFPLRKKKKMAFRQACTQKHVYNRTATRRREREWPRYPYISGWISIFIPFADGTSEKWSGGGVRAWTRGGGSRRERGGRVRNASGLTSRFDAMQTAPANYPQSPPFSDFMPIVYRRPLCAAENAHRVFIQLSVLAPCIFGVAARVVTGVIQSDTSMLCLDRWLSSFTAFNSLPRYLVEIMTPHVPRRDRVQ